MNRNTIIIISTVATALLVIFWDVLWAIIGSYLENTLPSIIQKSYPVAIVVLLISTAVVLRSIAGILRAIELKLSRLELQEVVRAKLHDLFTALKNNEEKAKGNRYFQSLQGKILEEAQEQINGIGTITPSNPLLVDNEYQRVQFIRHLFKSDACKKIIAVTYDHNGYFLNFWGGQNFDEFIRANQTAAKKATIERFFIFNKADFENPNNDEKQVLYNQIISNLEKLKPKIQHHKIWEEDLLRLSPGFPKRSFLIIDNHVTSEIKYGHGRGYLAFGDQESINELRNRYNKLSQAVTPHTSR